MKIESIKKYNNKIVELQILKLYYKKESYNFKTSLKITECHLNKIAHIVYNYHIHNKRILFLGFPENFKTLLKPTKHILLSKDSWMNGMLSNRNFNRTQQNYSNEKQIRKPTYHYKLMSELRKKLDLTIVYNLDSGTTAIKENYLARIPVITFSKDLAISNKQVTYESPEKFYIVSDRKVNNNLFFSIIRTTLKRALRARKIKETLQPVSLYKKRTTKKNLRYSVKKINK